MAEAMKKGFEDVQRMVSSYVPPTPVGVTKPIGDEDGFFPFPPEYEASSNTTVPLNPPPSSGDAKQEELENQMVGVTQPTGRKRLRSMGVGEVSGTLPLNRRLLDFLERELKVRSRDARREMRDDQERQRRTRGKYPFVGPDWYPNPNSTRNYYDDEEGKIQLGLAGENEESILSDHSFSPNLDSLAAHELSHYFQRRVPWFENARTVGGGAYGGRRIDHNLAGRHIRRILQGKFDVEDSVPDKDVRESLEETYATELPAYAMMGHSPRATARGLLGQTKGMIEEVTPRGKYPNRSQRILANLPEAAMDKQKILDFTPLPWMDEYDEEGVLDYSNLAGLRARLGYLPPQEEWNDAIREQIIQDIGVKRMRADAKKGKGKRKDIVDFLARNEKYKKTGELMEIPFQLLKYATVRHLRNPKLIDIRRIAEQNLADNTSDPSESYKYWANRYKKDDPRITLIGRDERKGVFLGPTGRQYETHEHRAAVDGGTLDDYDFEGYSRPYSDVKIPFPDWEKKYVPPKEPVNPNVDEPYDEMFNQYYSKTLGMPMKVKSEPMDIVFQLLKERKSPEAWANKKRYDSEYQKTPKRVKYREQLNAERRKRGIYGKGGKDVSHTQGGKLTLESAHANRARHFKNRGTLRNVKKSAVGVVDGHGDGRICPSCGKPGVFRVFKPRCVYCGWEQQ